MEFWIRMGLMTAVALSMGMSSFGAGWVDYEDRAEIESPAATDAAGLFGAAEKRLLDIPERLQFGEKLSQKEKAWAREELARELARLKTPGYAKAVLAEVKRTYPGGRVIVSRWGESDELVSVDEYAVLWMGRMEAQLYGVKRALDRGPLAPSYTREDEDAFNSVPWGRDWQAIFEAIEDGRRVSKAQMKWAREELADWRADLAADDYQAKALWFHGPKHPTGKLIVDDPRGGGEEIITVSEFVLRERTRERREMHLVEGMLKRAKLR